MHNYMPYAPTYVTNNSAAVHSYNNINFQMSQINILSGFVHDSCLPL